MNIEHLICRKIKGGIFKKQIVITSTFSALRDSVTRFATPFLFGKTIYLDYKIKGVVPGSNPASLTVENSKERQSHCVYCKISGQRGRPHPEAKKR